MKEALKKIKALKVALNKYVQGRENFEEILE
jgi:hypothetical protein